MNYSGIIKADFANGLGVRVTLFVSGCDLRCHGCHSPKLWDYENGVPFDNGAKEEVMSCLQKDWVSGLTLSGGQPLAPENIASVYELVREVKERFPLKNIWLYTGYTLSPEDFSGTNDSPLQLYTGYTLSPEDFSGTNDSPLHRTIALCDVIVDGEYDEAKRDTTLAFRGSSNQRIIDVKQTMASGKIVTFAID